jgi:enoyl-CoA hydratase/carnithine racemase
VIREEHGEDGVRVLTLDAPGQRNALDYATVASLTAALRRADEDPSARAVLITADGPVFSAGANLREFRDELAGSATDFYESGAVWEDLFTFVPRMGTPVVIAVDGPARAGAFGLVALGDIVIASERADFSLSEIRIGLFPIMVMPAVMRVLGYRVAQELALTGRIIDADEAMRIGLVTRVVDSGTLVEEARRTAAELAASAPRAMGFGRRLIARLADLPYPEAVHHARTMRGTFLHTPDIREGVDAFLEKRSPSWPALDDTADGRTAGTHKEDRS